MRVHKNKFENATKERMSKRGIKKEKKRRREGANEKSSNFLGSRTWPSC